MRRGLVLVCLAGVVWGTIGPAVAVVDDRAGLSVLVVGAYRALSAVAALACAALLLGRARDCLVLVRRQGRRAAAAGVLTGTFQLLFFVAVVQVGVSVTTVVSLGFAPVLLLVLHGVQRRRRPPAGQAVTVAAAVVGLALVGWGGAGGSTGSGEGGAAVLGLLAALASGAAYGLSADVGAPLSRAHDPLAVTTVTMGTAAVVLVPAGALAVTVGGARPGTGDAWSWALVAYLGVVTMAGAYLMLYAGLRTTPSGAAVVATLLEPVTAVAIAVGLLGEQLTAAGLAGSLLILASIANLGRGLEPPQPQ